MIILFTDFSYNGPFVGQLKSAIYQVNNDITIIDLMHDAPMFDIKHSACLLKSLYINLPDESVVCCVVDPGVGSDRQAIVIKTDGKYFIGPDNGLFEYILRDNSNTLAYKINFQPKTLSSTFHGRDIFAPIAAQIHQNQFGSLELIGLTDIQRFDWDNNLAEIIYIDSFCNLTTGIVAESISQKTIIKYQGYCISFVNTYADMVGEQLFWYVNSNGLVEIGINSKNAAVQLNAQIGDVVELI